MGHTGKRADWQQLKQWNLVDTRSRQAFPPHDWHPSVYLDFSIGIAPDAAPELRDGAR